MFVNKILLQFSHTHLCIPFRFILVFSLYDSFNKNVYYADAWMRRQIHSLC